MYLLVQIFLYHTYVYTCIVLSAIPPHTVLFGGTICRPNKFQLIFLFLDLVSYLSNDHRQGYNLVSAIIES